jgi:Lon protease-like protein
MAPREIGIFALPLALAPGELLPLHVFEDRYRDLIADCMERDAPFLVLYKDDEGTREIGCTATVSEVLRRYDDGRLDVIVEGEAVVEVREITRGRSYTTAIVDDAADNPEPGGEQAAALEAYRRFAAASGLDAEDAIEVIEGPLSYMIMSRVELPGDEKQRLLETRSESGRLAALTGLLQRGLESLARVEEIRTRATGNGKVQQPRSG